jgi:hypothetical protein
MFNSLHTRKIINYYNKKGDDVFLHCERIIFYLHWEHLKIILFFMCIISAVARIFLCYFFPFLNALFQQLQDFLCFSVLTNAQPWQVLHLLIFPPWKESLYPRSFSIQTDSTVSRLIKSFEIIPNGPAYKRRCISLEMNYTSLNV